MSIAYWITFLTICVVHDAQSIECFDDKTDNIERKKGTEMEFKTESIKIFSTAPVYQ